MKQVTLKEARLKKLLTLNEVGAAIGVTGKTVYNWENGVSDIPVKKFYVLCKLYGVRPNNFILP